MLKITAVADTLGQKGLSCQEGVSQAFGSWLDGMADWEWFATLTFRDPNNPRYPNWTRVGWQYAHRALASLNSSLINLPESHNPVWVACMELQDRGVPHWHALFADTQGERRMDWVDWWFDHFGIARILPYQAELGARYYLGKYLTKQVADIRFSPALAIQLRKRADQRPMASA